MLKPGRGNLSKTHFLNTKRKETSSEECTPKSMGKNLPKRSSFGVPRKIKENSRFSDEFCPRSKQIEDGKTSYYREDPPIKFMRV